MLKEFFRQLTPKLKLQNQIILLLIFSTIIPVFLVGLYGISSSINALSNLAYEQIEVELKTETQLVNAFLDDVRNDVWFFSKSPSLQSIIQTKNNQVIKGQSNPDYKTGVEQLQKNFIAMMQTKSKYMQLRYLDDLGNEVVRVDSDGTNIKVIPEAELQNKADRPYFSETMKLMANDLYVSRLDLNQERGQIERPFKPVIRYATPVFDSAGQKRGIVIANVLANQFLKEFKSHQPTQEESHTPEGKLKFIVNQDGYYVAHPNSNKEWGFEFKNNQKLSKDYSPEIAKQILSSESGTFEKGHYLFAYHRIWPSPNQPTFLVVVNTIPKNSFFESVYSFAFVSVLIIVVSLGVVLPLGFRRARQIVNLIKQLVNAISTSSQQTFSALEQQERITGQQATSVQETTSAMDELEASCKQSAQQAKAAVDAAQQALALAFRGTQAVGETLEGMFTLEKKVEAIAHQISQLSEQANQIGSISRIVSELANQSNMLALNSSVEAAHAGEHGKRFAVVANEIRKLSDQSQKEAEKIKLLVSNIQKAVNSTVVVTESGTHTVKSGVQIAKTTDQAFAGVADAVNYMVLNNQQISLNLKQQLNAIQQVVEAMEAINKGAKETAIGISQTRVGTAELSKTTRTLRRMV